MGLCYKHANDRYSLLQLFIIAIFHISTYICKLMWLCLELLNSVVKYFICNKLPVLFPLNDSIVVNSLANIFNICFKLQIMLDSLVVSLKCACLLSVRCWFMVTAAVCKCIPTVIGDVINSISQLIDLCVFAYLCFCFLFFSFKKGLFP